ncbi:glycoside hydrolase family 105 protein [Desarmillaria tabescens]|uniref:Glycoside hydrolase family 105 protein n=1 Tax=Armillaria tabescens TaxID=1929756 RepID=A0AA39MS53_ARMTA|nr:glycoside hydrolase family 105 protein [Desarmillaria tabescens]KAK0444243.1 glycoside hydrolase family 105 protein [Desarmillaria tabescens]
MRFSSLPSVVTATIFLARASVYARPRSYAVWAADSAIARGQGDGLDSDGDPTVSYEHGELQWGLRLLYETTGNKSYFDYIVQGASQIVDSKGDIEGDYSFSDYSQDPIRTGPTFAYLYEKTGQSKWKTAMDTFHQQLMGQPRTAEGQFWHKLRYFNQGWLDGIYMGEIFYTVYTNAFQPTNTTAYADIAKQFDLMFQNTLQEEGAANYTGLLYHGYDYSHTASWASEDRGHSPEVWDRAMGWYMMALVDILEIYPKDKSVFLDHLNTLVPRVRDAADSESGVWWLVMTQPGRTGNYFESSGSAMFVYAMLKAVRLGYVSDNDRSIVKAATKAYQYMIDNWVVDNGDGTMNWLNTVKVGSLDGNGTFEYYISVAVDTNDLKGLAAFLLASLEYEKL